jgi:hypothetical protein
MTKIIRTAPLLFLYLVLLNTNSSAMDDHAIVETQKVDEWIRNQICIERHYTNKCLTILAHEPNNSHKIEAAYAHATLITGLNTIFRKGIERGLICDLAAQIPLATINDLVNQQPPISYTLKKDLYLCFGGYAGKITES